VGIFDPEEEDLTGLSYTGREFDALSDEEQREAVRHARCVERERESVCVFFFQSNAMCEKCVYMCRCVGVCVRVCACSLFYTGHDDLFKFNPRIMSYDDINIHASPL
jgi:hypothetical protein